MLRPIHFYTLQWVKDVDTENQTRIRKSYSDALIHTERFAFSVQLVFTSLVKVWMTLIVFREAYKTPDFLTLFKSFKIPLPVTPQKKIKHT